MGREGLRVARCRVRRLMREMGLAGAVRGRAWTITTQSQPTAERPSDLVDRNFTATRPNQLWIADFTYVATWRGFVYVAFVIDVFARRIVGWRVSSSLAIAFVLDALEQAIYDRCGDAPDGLVHHSDRGTQYLSMHYTDRLPVTTGEVIRKTTSCRAGTGRQLIAWTMYCQRGLRNLRKQPPFEAVTSSRTNDSGNDG